MVLLLRAKGVPARLVNGFLGGVWNGVGGYMAVRQGDAHSWVEVALPGAGWVPYDPTPASDVLPVRQSPTRAWLWDSYDAAKMAWMRTVIEYDLDAQLAILKGLGKGVTRGFGDKKKQADQASNKPGQPRQLPWGQLLVWGVWLAICAASYKAMARLTGRSGRLLSPGAVLVLGALSAAGGAWLAAANHWSAGSAALGCLGVAAAGVAGVVRRAPRDEARSRAKAKGLFGRFERVLTTQGLVRRSDEGPWAFCQRAALALPHTSEAVLGFGRLYVLARFGAGQLEPAEWAALEQALGRAEREVRAG